jgi:predicted RNase H-like nuclease
MMWLETADDDHQQFFYWRRGTKAAITVAVTVTRSCAMRFIGLDLAWSARNLTGAAVIDGDATAGRLLATTLLDDDEAIVAFVAQYAGDAPALVTIDAPLVVPNATGRRPAEAAIARAFARYHAGAHPANRSRLARNGVVRGELLVERLAALGFVHRAEVTALEPVRQVLEVFPHPALVALFDLDRIIPYKARPHRSHAQRITAFRQLQAHLRSLASAEPALLDAAALLDDPLEFAVQARLKDYEDRLDGLICAYIGQYLWRWGMARARVFGDFQRGYITTPVPPLMWPDRS